MASSNSVAKPDSPVSDIALVIAFYNITWANSRFAQRDRHERTLAADIQAALHEFSADVLLLSECGEVDVGLIEKEWLPMLDRICGPGFDIKHQGHYTSIVRLSNVKIVSKPSLKGPLTTNPHHAYRMCQHLQVVPVDSVDKPIDLYNIHSPASNKKKLVRGTQTCRPRANATALFGRMIEV